MRVNIKGWGNSAAVRIPKAILEECELAISSPVDLHIEKGRIVIEPIQENTFNLKAMLDQITPENMHGEIDFGAPVGKELL